MKKLNRVKIICCVTLCSMLALVCSSIAVADIEIFSNDKIDLNLYGQVNRAAMYVDDGDTGEFYHVDNDNSSSRLGLKVKTKTKGLFTVGANLEFEYQSNASNKVWQEESNTDADWDERKIEAYIKGAFGKISLGQGSTASDGTSEVDFSGTKVAGYSNVNAVGGDFRFFDEDANSLSSSPIDKTFNNLDGLSRKDRARYDTPKFNGFSLAVSTATDEGDDAEDLALRYTGKLGDVKTAAAVSYVHYSSSDSKKSQVSGSASVLMKNGFNVSIAAGNLEHESSGRDDATFYYAKLGYQATLNSYGPTSFAIDYGKFDDFQQNEDEGDTIGFQCVQKLKDWKTELYLAVRHYELDRDGANYDDVDIALAGLRLKF